LGELHLPSYDLFSATEIPGRLALEKMLGGLSSRRYGHGLEPAGAAVEDVASATSKSAVSRRYCGRPGSAHISRVGDAAAGVGSSGTGGGD
jgi:hypothetical protein